MKSYNLDTYLADSYYLQIPSNKNIKAIEFNSKLIKKNSLFVAIKGLSVDGNDYIEQAINNGATLIVSEYIPTIIKKDIGYLIVKDARYALSKLSQVFYNFADKKLKIIAVTGTDGKTSTAYFTYNLLKQTNFKVGLISTTYIDINNKLEDSPYRQSTPDANILFYLISQCTKNNIQYLVLETTSHSLSNEFNRLSDMKFDLAIITTITDEHLDFHKSRKKYIEAKLNIIKRLKDNGFLITTRNNKEIEKCISTSVYFNKHYYILEDNINYSIKRNEGLSQLSIIFNNKEYKTYIYFDIFISNFMLSILAINKLLNIDIDLLLEKAINISDIKGRFNIIENNINRTIIVDFAHTSDSFEKLLSFISTFNKRIIILFGCGGERDISKRFEMGKISAKYCSIIVLSEEDPRCEDNYKIMKDIEKGINFINKDLQYYCINDRKTAIKKVLELSNENDILLFLGKGHEKTIERNKIKYDYDEISCIGEEIQKLYE